MNRIYISITQEDIEAASSYKLPPLLFVLVRTTGTLWRVSHCGVAVELIAPYRTFELPDEAKLLWQHSCESGTTIPHRFTVQCQRLAAIQPMKLSMV